MTNPWLNLAIGGLKGAEANRQRRTEEEERKRKHETEDLNLRLRLADEAETNRQRRTEEEERKRKHETEDLNLRLRLAELAASNPDEFELSGFPFVDAATAAPAGAGGSPPRAPGLPPPAAPGMARRWRPDTGWQEAPIGKPAEARPVPAAGLPATPAAPGRARRWRPDTGWQEAPIGKPEEAGPVPGVQGPVSPKPTAAMPSTPFLDRAIELGKVNVGGQDVSIIQHPGRTKALKEAKNRAAFEALHEADSEAYPAYIESADYAKEMADYSSGVRAGRIENKRAIRTGSAAAATAAARVRRDLAEDIAYDMFERGATLEEVQAAVAKDAQARGGLSSARARAIQRDAARAAPDTERARQRITTQLGKPPQALGGRAPIDAETQQDVVDALARGHTGEEILAAIGDPALAQAVEKWLRQGGQLKPPARRQ